MALKAARGSLSGATRARSQPAQAEDVRTLALDLVPLVAPYRSRGKLSLRVERMQQHSRLSHGRNNGDRSWSLACDELEGLQYLVRADTFEPHALSVRIVDIEQHGTTLAVVEVPVTLDGKPRHVPARDAEAPQASAGETKSLKREVENLKSELAARDGELSRQAAELATLQEHADTQLREQLATANALAQQALEEKHKAWQSERDALIAGSGKAAEQAVAAARAQWEREARDAAQAAARRNDEDRNRLQQLTAAVAEANARAEKAEAALAAGKAQRAAGDAERAEKQRAREDELSKALAGMTARAEQADTALVRANSDIARIEREMRADIDALNVKLAKRSAEEAARMAAAEQAWKAQADKKAADLAERCARAEADIARARGEARSNASLDEQKLRDELSRATQQSAERERALADAQAKIARFANDATEHDRTRAELAAARTELETLRAAASSAPSAMEDPTPADPAEMERRIQAEVTDALGKARTEWAQGEAAKLAELEARLLAQSEAALGDADARAQEAEQALEKLRADLASSMHNRLASGEIGQLQNQIVSLQADIAARDSELARLRQTVREYELYRPEGSSGERPESEEAPSKPAGRLVRDLIVVAVIVALPIILFPYVEPMLPYSWQYEIETMIPQLSSGPGDQQAAPEPARKATAKPVAAPEPKAVVARPARLHAGPKTASPTLSIVPGGTGVSVLGKSGNWTMVQVGGTKGWIYGTYLKDAPKAKSGN